MERDSVELELSASEKYDRCVDERRIEWGWEGEGLGVRRSIFRQGAQQCWSYSFYFTLFYFILLFLTYFICFILVSSFYFIGRVRWSTVISIVIVDAIPKASGVSFWIPFLHSLTVYMWQDQKTTYLSSWVRECKPAYPATVSILYFLRCLGHDHRNL